MAKRKKVSNREKREMYLKFKNKYSGVQSEIIEKDKIELKKLNDKLLFSMFPLFSIGGICFIIFFVLLLSIDDDSINPIAIICVVIGGILIAIGALVFNFYYKNNINLEFFNQELSSRDFHKTNVQNSSIYGIDHIQSLKFYTFEEILKHGDLPFVKSGIYAFYCFDKYNKADDPIIPLYVGQAKDIWKRWKEHANKIIKAEKGDHNSEAKYQKINYYLRFKGLDIINIKFCVLFETLDSDLKKYETEWMRKTGAVYNGWNSVK